LKNWHSSLPKLRSSVVNATQPFPMPWLLADSANEAESSGISLRWANPRNTIALSMRWRRDVMAYVLGNGDHSPLPKFHLNAVQSKHSAGQRCPAGLRTLATA